MTYQLISPLPHDEQLVAALGGEWQRFGRPGTWWAGAERVAIAHEARAARTCGLCAERKTALSPEVGAPHEPSGPLSAPAVDSVHRIASDPGRLSERWAKQVFSAGLSAEQLVELTGIVAILTIGDTLAHASGAPESALPEPVAGEPSQMRPTGLETESAWVPVVHPERAEGEMKEAFVRFRMAVGYVFNIGRALTLVPAEFEGFGRAFYPTYPSHGDPPPGDLSRAQIELLAAVISAANECFY